MRPEEYEELINLYESPLEKSTVLRYESNYQHFILRKKITNSDHYKIILKEILQRKKLEHANITTLLKADIDTNLQSIANYYQYSPYNINNIAFNNINAVLQLAIEGLKGIRYLHQNHLPHGDIRPESIGYFPNDKTFKLLERVSSKTVADLQMDYILAGQELYMEPFMYNQLSNRGVNGVGSNLFKNDVFAFGMVIIKAANPHLLDLSRVDDRKHKLFNYGEFMLQLNNGVKLSRSTEYQRFIDLVINGLLESNSQERYTAEKALQYIANFAKTIKVTEPKFDLKFEAVYMKSPKSVYLGVSSEQFTSKGIIKPRMPYSILNYIHKLYDERKCKNNNTTIDTKVDKDKYDRSANSPVIGFVADVDEFSEVSVQYEDEERDEKSRSIKVSTPNREKFFHEINECERLVDTQKKRLSSNQSNGSIEIEIRSKMNRIDDTKGSKILELNFVEDFSIKYTSTNVSLLEIGYIINKRKCKRIIPTDDLFNKPLIVKIKRLKSHIMVNTPQIDKYSPSRVEPRTQTSLKTQNKNQTGSIYGRQLIKNFEPMEKSYTHVPLNFRDKFMQYKERQSHQDALWSGNRAVKDIFRNSHRESYLYTHKAYDNERISCTSHNSYYGNVSIFHRLQI